MLRRVAVLVWLAASVAGCDEGGESEPSDAGASAPGNVPGGYGIDYQALPEARVGQLFEQPIAAPDGARPRSLSLAAEAPQWLTLNVEADGSATLAGTPEHSGTYPVEVVVETADGERTAAKWSLQVKPKRWAVYTGSAETRPEQQASPDLETTMIVELDAQAVAPPEPMILPGSAGMIVQWSGDGAWLAGSDFTDALAIWDMGGLAPSAPQIVHSAVPGVELIQAAPIGSRFFVPSVNDPDSCPVASGSARDDCLGAMKHHSYVLDATEPPGSQLTELGIADFELPVAWSPDASSFLAKSYDADTRTATVFLVELGPGAREPWALSLSMEYGDASWSPDGRWIVVSGYDPDGQKLYLINRADARPDGREVPWATAADESVSPLGWSPDGAWLLLLSSRSDGSSVQLVDMRGDHPGDRLTIPWQGSSTDDTQRIFDALWAPNGELFALVVGIGPVDLLVFDVAASSSGPIWQQRLTQPDGSPFVAWTAASALVFRDGESLLLQVMGGGIQAQVIAQDAGPVPIPYSEILLSPDHRRLVYQTSAENSVLRMVTFDSPANEPVPLRGDPAWSVYWRAQWLAGGSGLAAYTSVADAVGGVPGYCFHSCRLEYAFLSADGALQRAHMVSGGAYSLRQEPLLLQP